MAYTPYVLQHPRQMIPWQSLGGKGLRKKKFYFFLLKTKLTKKLSTAKSWRVQLHVPRVGRLAKANRERSVFEKCMNDKNSIETAKIVTSSTLFTPAGTRHREVVEEQRSISSLARQLYAFSPLRNNNIAFDGSRVGVAWHIGKHVCDISSSSWEIHNVDGNLVSYFL